MVFGLALKLTKGTFAPRDGKPRDPSAPVIANGNPVATAEVVDIEKVAEAAAPNTPAAQPKRVADPVAAHPNNNGNGHPKLEESHA